jgi:hypothetical protein
MRAGIVVEVTPEDRVRLERIVRDRNTPQKHSAPARVILATAEDCGTLGDRAPLRPVEAGRLALAGAVHA